MLKASNPSVSSPKSMDQSSLETYRYGTPDGAQQTGKPMRPLPVDWAPISRFAISRNAGPSSSHNHYRPIIVTNHCNTRWTSFFLFWSWPQGPIGTESAHSNRHSFNMSIEKGREKKEKQSKTNSILKCFQTQSCDFVFFVKIKREFRILSSFLYVDLMEFVLSFFNRGGINQNKRKETEITVLITDDERIGNGGVVSFIGIDSPDADHFRAGG